MTSLSTNWEAAFVNAGALWRYHSGPHAVHELSSVHSDFYLNTDVLLSEPSSAQQISSTIGDTIAKLAEKEPISVVAPYSTIGAPLILATMVAMQCSLPLYYVPVTSPMLQPAIPTDTTLIIVTDDVHSGGSINRICEAASEAGLRVHNSIYCIADFSPTGMIGPRSIVPLYRQHPIRWSAFDCPLCKSGSPPLNARREWARLTAPITNQHAS